MTDEVVVLFGVGHSAETGTWKLIVKVNDRVHEGPSVYRSEADALAALDDVGALSAPVIAAMTTYHLGEANLLDPPVKGS